MAQPNSPLTLDHLQQLNNALSLVKVARDQIELAKRAGIDIGDAETTNDASETKLRNLKQVYFPGQ